MATAARSAVVGVLGGMGPAATADFYQKLVTATPALTDQQHLKVVLWSDPTVPDRSAALQGNGPDPTPWLLNGARILSAAGAELIAVPCNTAHAFLPTVEEQTGVRIVHMIDQTVRDVHHTTPWIRRIGLLATTGTVRANLYQDWFVRAGVQVVLPTAEEQHGLVDAAIRAVKAGERGARVTGLLAAAGENLANRGAAALIAGCTEIPLVFDERSASIPVIDPTWVLAKAVVAAAYPPDPSGPALVTPRFRQEHGHADL
jgi:aspartate racemase